MSYGHPSSYTSTPVEMLGVDARATFITRTYNHLLAAILGFVLVEVFFFTTGLAEVMARAMLGVNWLLVLGGFVLVSWLATRAAETSASLGTQYMALAGFVVAQAVIFVPMLYIAQMYAGGGVIESAALVTLARLRSSDRDRVLDAEGFLVPRRAAPVGRHPGAGRYRSRRALRVRAGDLVLGGDDRIGGGRRFSTTPPTSSTTIRRTGTWGRRSRCSRRSP